MPCGKCRVFVGKDPWCSRPETADHTETVWACGPPELNAHLCPPHPTKAQIYWASSEGPTHGEMGTRGPACAPLAPEPFCPVKVTETESCGAKATRPGLSLTSQYSWFGNRPISCNKVQRPCLFFTSGKKISQRVLVCYSILPIYCSYLP